MHDGEAREATLLVKRRPQVLVCHIIVDFNDYTVTRALLQVRVPGSLALHHHRTNGPSFQRHRGCLVGVFGRQKAMHDLRIQDHGILPDL